LRWPACAQHPWRDGFNPHLVLVDGRFRVSCIMAAIQHGVPKIVVHDFWTRRRLHTVLEFATVVDRVDALAVLKPKEGSPAWRATLVEWRHRYDWRQSLATTSLVCTYPSEHALSLLLAGYRGQAPV
ncbi:MAG TPA: hypothetical protein VFY92_00610, partial [Hyphomicrobiaceae bacterium]|nr:hypothetical protein [Hyphomicrobiaceae bacterium]